MVAPNIKGLALPDWLTADVMQRLTLLINHVLSAEPAAPMRLKAHAGKEINFRLDGWPGLLPSPPSLLFMITPAGLVEWSASSSQGGESQLTWVIDARNPVRLLLSPASRTPMDVVGDPLFAADVRWVLENLRWEVADDLARIVGPQGAHRLTVFGRSALDALNALWRRRAPTSPSEPGDR